MGVTSFEIEKLSSIIQEYKPSWVIELGSQTNYTTPDQVKPPFMTGWYNERGVMYRCIDLAGDNDALPFDLSDTISVTKGYGLVTDFGTSEHCVRMKDYVNVAFHEGHINSIYPKGEVTEDDVKVGYYNCWKNKHALAKIGGIIFSVNPMTNHWPGHGYTYLGFDFYTQLAEIAGFEILEQGIVAAMGNSETGMNVFGIIRKTSETFPDIDLFYTLPIFRK